MEVAGGAWQASNPEAVVTNILIYLWEIKTVSL